MKRLYLFLITLLALILVISLAANLYLFSQGRRYYADLNETRLDPLGLNAYQPATANADGGINVLFYGDSRAASWPAPDLKGVTFFNRGIGAQTSAQVWLRFPVDVPPLKPQVMIVQVGINDLKTIPLFPDRKAAIIAACEENIRQIVSAANDSGATVILTTIFPVGNVPLERRPFWSDDVKLAVDEVNTHLRTLASEQVILFDAYAVLADADGLMAAQYRTDELHNNAAGYAALNQALLPILDAAVQPV